MGRPAPSTRAVLGEIAPDVVFGSYISPFACVAAQIFSSALYVTLHERREAPVRHAGKEWTRILTVRRRWLSSCRGSMC